MVKDLKGLRIDPEKKGGFRRNDNRSWVLVVAFLLAGAGVIALIYAYLRLAPDTSAQIPVEQGATANESESEARTTGEVLRASGYIVAHHKIAIGSKVMGKV